MTMENYPVWVVIAAGGHGSRMQLKTPKQFITLCKAPVITHSLNLFLSHSLIHGVILVLPPGEQDKEIPSNRLFMKPKRVVGGDTRSQSVLNGLAAIPDEQCWVLVHDAARPCLTLTDIDLLLESRYRYQQGAILATPVVDTLKQIDASSHITSTLSRKECVRALTPQMALKHDLYHAYQHCHKQGDDVTDEAQALEMQGIQCGVVLGRNDNIKITQIEDLALAEFYIMQQIQVGLR